MAETFLQQAIRIARTESGVKRQTKKSVEWFRKYMAQFRTASRPELLEADEFKTVKRLSPGFMYMYRYHAKHEDTLPYWDRFPLIFAIGPAAKGFAGANLHYLSPTRRAIFFDKLLGIANRKDWSERKRLSVSYEVLSSMTKFNEFKPCYKHYLFKQVRSNVVKVPARYWEAVLFMPTAQWVGASETKVWRESAKLIRKG